MDTLLFITKIAAILTVLYAGINIHQLTSSYGYLQTKAEEFRSAITEAGGFPRLARLNLLFYIVLPFSYLTLLRCSSLHFRILAIIALKFMLTASLDLWIEKTILTGKNYSSTQHNLSRLDNLLNITSATAIIYYLLKAP